ncbi:malonic semialdehyde reductase RutE [uncultured archaeon]|nr:malonic semialdehyde reductase RutE [uncultured archaeon]
MELNEVVMKRYATKKFDGKQIPGKKLNELLDIIRFSASSYNMQPWKIKVISDGETKKKLLEATYGQEQIMSCSSILVFCADTDLEAKIAELEREMLESGSKKESIAGFINTLKGFSQGLQGKERLCWAQKQVYLALGNAINGAKSLGFDSCPMEGFKPQEYSRILGLPEHIVPTVLCTIGYGADTPRPKMRLPKEKVYF